MLLKESGGLCLCLCEGVDAWGTKSGIWGDGRARRDLREPLTFPFFATPPFAQINLSGSHILCDGAIVGHQGVTEFTPVLNLPLASGVSGLGSGSGLKRYHWFASTSNVHYCHKKVKLKVCCWFCFNLVHFKEAKYMYFSYRVKG